MAEERRIIERRTDTCPQCNGEGVYYEPSCATCGRTFEPYAIEAMFKKHESIGFEHMRLPCGHRCSENLQEEQPCRRCEETGEVHSERDVTAAFDALLQACQWAVSELQHVRRNSDDPGHVTEAERCCQHALALARGEGNEDAH